MAINEARNIGSLTCPLRLNSVFIFTGILVSGAVFLGNEVLPKLIGSPIHLLALPVPGSERTGRRPPWALAAQSDVFLASAENNSSVPLIKISSPGNDLVPELEQSGTEYVLQLNYYCGHSYKKGEGGENVRLVSFLGAFNLGSL